MMKKMNSMKTFNKLIVISMVLLLCGFFANAMAQSSRRYAEPVFEEVNVESDIPFSSVIEEGETSPITLYLDFYEPQGDTLSVRPLVITVFGGAFVAGGRDYVDMVLHTLGSAWLCGGFHRLSAAFDLESQCHLISARCLHGSSRCQLRDSVFQMPLRRIQDRPRTGVPAR